MGKNLKKQYSFRCDDMIIKKLEYIAEQDERNRNNLMIKILKDYIEQYEADHGAIKIDENDV